MCIPSHTRHVLYIQKINCNPLRYFKIRYARAWIDIDRGTHQSLWNYIKITGWIIGEYEIWKNLLRLSIVRIIVMNINWQEHIMNWGLFRHSARDRSVWNLQQKNTSLAQSSKGDNIQEHIDAITKLNKIQTRALI